MAGAVTAPLLVLDAVLVTTLLVVGRGALSSEDPFKAIALFVAFGLLMTICWVRLEAVDVALAEAAIGSGFTGALFLAGLSRLRRQDEQRHRNVRDPVAEKLP